LIISLFSLLLSLTEFIWNVWLKFVFPKPCVALSFMDIRARLMRLR
jgi:hypothetical protein